MKWGNILSGVVGLLLTLAATMPVSLVRAEADEPKLLISHYKVTSSSGQFVELFNNTTEPIDMSTVQLVYYNNYDVSKATSSKLISLSGSLPAGGYYLVNDSAMNLCYQTMVASASLSFSSTAGLVQVHQLSQTMAGGPIASEITDSAAWSKTAVAGVQTLPSSTNAFLQRRWPENEAKAAGGGLWLAVQPSAVNPCQLESVLPSMEIETDDFIFLPSTLPPVRFVAASSSKAGPVNRNIGKMAPIINEILPNPASPQTDADDEFIELYNPNDSSFDLSGFKLAFGSTNPKKYTFPEGTVLSAKTFRIFTSGDTSISLSNEAAQVWLLDPNDKVIDTSQPYSSAKDGQAWALNNGAWIWTLQPSPNSMNTLAAAVGSGSKTAAATLGITSVGGTDNDSSTSARNPTSLADATPLHPSALAAVGMGAVGYALYEYRGDMANRIFQLRRYLRARRSLRS